MDPRKLVHHHETKTTMPTEPMKLVVLGATGKSGKLVVTQALEQGHSVTAVVRNPSKMDISHGNLTVVHLPSSDSIFQRECLTPVFKGKDAVISCLGLPIPFIQMPFGKRTLLHNSMRAIVPAMRMANVKRLVAISSWFLDVNNTEGMPPYFRWVQIPFKYSQLLDDHYEMEKYVERECPDINYTLVRMPALLDDPQSDKLIKVIDDGAMYLPNTFFVARADAARFMLSCLGTDQWDKKSPAIATH